MIDDLILSNPNKIVLLILDGLGDIPNPDHNFMTPLEAAGSIGTIYSRELMTLALAHALQLDKYGA